MRVTTLIGTASLLLSTTALAQNVTYDFAKATEFSALKTYAWVRGTGLDDELNHQRIVDAVDSQLTSKGLRKVEPGAGPDLLVAYHTIFGREVQVNGLSSGWGGYRFGPARSGTARVEQVVVGALVVDLMDPKTGSIVWRGVATKDVEVEASPEKREKNINQTAGKLFQHYPPNQ